MESEIKQKVRNLLGNYEQLLAENDAFRVILRSVNWPGIPVNPATPSGVPGWENTLAELLGNKHVRDQRHAQFLPLYAALEQELDDLSLAKLLSQIPQSGTVH